tara:strand:- start:318 stop:527 length:210 start_codon:yes stop_codon:yes gene_type:complete
VARWNTKNVRPIFRCFVNFVDKFQDWRRGSFSAQVSVGKVDCMYRDLNFLFNLSEDGVILIASGAMKEK